MRDVSSPTGAVAAFRTLGALVSDGATEFRVWAPEADAVELVLLPGGVRPLGRERDGHWSGRFEDVGTGARYKLRLDREPAKTFPDPASRFQPDGVHGPSEVVDPFAFRWTDAAWTPPPLERLVVYELHVGTFTPEGTFTAAIQRLRALVNLGVNAVELMPVGDFPGEHNWGYDGVAIFAPARCYGTPDDLRALVDAAHGLGVAVLLDVVYNHLGPDGAYANAFSPYYFTDAHCSPWGRGVNLDGPHSDAVRRFFIENALHWIREYHVDGLRLDATHAMRDDRPRHFIAELTDTVRAEARRPVVIVAEDHRNLVEMLTPVADGGLGLDGVWADDFHHQVRVHAAGDREGYYADFSGTTADLAATLRQGWFYTGQYSEYLKEPRGTDPRDVDLPRFVICTQNHDQIGNRADGARLHQEIDAAAYRAVQTLLLLAPETPLLFMGQEWAATTPFLFFTDHHEELGRQVTEGRREEFKSFAAFADPKRRAMIPDPQALETFERSRLRWDERSRPPHDGILELHRRLIEVRRGIPGLGDSRRRDRFIAQALDPHTLALGHGGGPVVVSRLSGGAGAVTVQVHEAGPVVLTTEDPDFVGDGQPTEIQRAPSADGREGLVIVFRRPGAVVMRAVLA